MQGLFRSVIEFVLDGLGVGREMVQCHSTLMHKADMPNCVCQFYVFGAINADLSSTSSWFQVLLPSSKFSTAISYCNSSGPYLTFGNFSKGRACLLWRNQSTNFCMDATLHTMGQLNLWYVHILISTDRTGHALFCNYPFVCVKECNFSGIHSKRSFFLEKLQ